MRLRAMSPDVASPHCVLVFRTIASNSPEIDGPFETLIGVVKTEGDARKLEEAHASAGIVWEVIPYTGPPPSVGATSVWVAVESGVDSETVRMSPSPMAVFGVRERARSWLLATEEPAAVWEVDFGHIDLSCPKWPGLDRDK